MTWILFLLCLAIAGRELYLAFDRKRPPGSAPELDDIRTRLTALKNTRDDFERHRSAQREQTERLASTQAEHADSLGETDARIRSLITQINDRMLPEVNARLSQQREAADQLATEVAQLRDHLIGRLDQAVAASLGSDQVDTVAGALSTGHADALAHAFELFAARYGMRVELTDPAAYQADRPESGQTRYYLSGRSPRGLERDFIDLLRTLATSRDNGSEAAGGPGTEAARVLLAALRQTERSGAQIGPLVMVRTPDSLTCGVLPLAELRRTEPAALIADPSTTATRLSHLPQGRFYDAATKPGL